MLASLDLSQSWQEGVNGFSETLLSGAGVFDCLNSSAKVIGVPWKDGIIMASIDLDTFFDGFGLRPETVFKIKEMGFTAKTLMSNVDELPSLLESINQHHLLTLGEEWGIKGAAKKWQLDQTYAPHPEDEKWPESEDTCKEVACIDSEEVTQLEPCSKWMQQQQQGQQLPSSHNHLGPSNLTGSNLSPSNQGVSDVGPGGSPGRVGYYTNLLSYQSQGNARFDIMREVDVTSQRQPQIKHSFDHVVGTTF
uniref:Floricaula/leafy-like transcription factor n=1 Tax=Physcomitrium patens TaxID=3218 RepID=A0A7I4F4X3_PHYPA